MWDCNACWIQGAGADRHGGSLHDKAIVLLPHCIALRMSMMKVRHASMEQILHFISVSLFGSNREYDCTQHSK